MIKPWSRVATKQVGDFRIFDVRSDHKVSPRTGKVHDFYVIQSVNWVNVIALTADDQLVMVEQYRHGSETVELEIPGGMLDSNQESPVAAGERELREETGYAGERARIIGEVYPNPAIMSNTCYTVLVENCSKQHALELDHTEDVATRLVPVGQIPDLVASGKIRHALVVVALYHYELGKRRAAPAL